MKKYKLDNTGTSLVRLGKEFVLLIFKSRSPLQSYVQEVDAADSSSEEVGTAGENLDLLENHVPSKEDIREHVKI